MAYTLKTGQINFENDENPGAYSCIVIKDGKFHNLTGEIRAQLVKILQSQNCGDKPQAMTLDDMF